MRRSLALVAACAALATSSAAWAAGAPPPAPVPLSRASGDDLVPHTGRAVAVVVAVHPRPAARPAPVAAPARPRPPAPTHPSARATRPAATVAASHPRLLVERLHGVGAARQVISVVAAGYGTSHATLQAFTKGTNGWARTFGPWSVRIGRNGFAPSGDKREGDGRTPSGSYGFSFMFGVKADPGVRYEYRRVTGNYLVWADDPGTPRYNLWTDTRTQDGGPSPEPLYNVPAYNYSAVIAYNTARVSGRGSAIFMHVGGGSGTAGCVAMPTDELLKVLRWMDPAKGTRIIMGTESAVT